MDTDQNWLLGLGVALIAALPVIAVMLLTEMEKFAGIRKSLAATASKYLPLAIIEPFEVVYGSKRIVSANRKALLAAKKRGQAQAKALRRNNSR